VFVFPDPLGFGEGLLDDEIVGMDRVAERDGAIQLVAKYTDRSCVAHPAAGAVKVARPSVLEMLARSLNSLDAPELTRRLSRP
jgi:hypothetical protein